MAHRHSAPLSESLRVPRLRWPLVVLFLSIGLTAVAAFDAQRVVRSQRRLAERALSEYASFATWSVAEHLAISLNAIEREAIGAVNHGDNLHTSRTIPLARDLAHYLPWDERCQCHRSYAGPNPEAFFALNLRARALNVGLNTHETAGEGWEVDRPMSETMKRELISAPHDVAVARVYTDEEREWLLDSLSARVRALDPRDHGFYFVVSGDPAAPRVFAYTLMPTSWGDTLVYGARYSQESFSRIISSVLDGEGLLPASITQGRRNRDVLAVIVRDRAGRPIFATDSTLALSAHVTAPDRAAGLSIDAAIRPEVAGSLLVGGFPASRLPFLLGLLGLAAALSIVAVTQLRREGELARMRGEFVSSVSHELRTPLAQIRLYVETLRLGRASTEAQREWSLAHIARETTRLSHLVENVLRFSSLGRADPAIGQEIDVSAEVARIADEFGPLASSRRARVQVRTGPTPPLAMSPDALRHIVLNLLDNAVKYGPPGQTVCIAVALDGAEITIVVDDEGPGVAAGDRELVWQPFSRGSSARASGGSGIGLTIVREVAESHGGSACVRPSPSGGARFIVTLPVSAPEPAAQLAAEPAPV